jgi:cytochrome bd-type quinol oxidase subunit 1
MLLTSLIGFILVYGLLIAANIYLMIKFAKAGPAVKPELADNSATSLVEPGVPQ